MTDAPNRDQAEYWSSEPGTRWVEHQLVLDTAMAPVLDCLMREAALPAGAAVLDVGCGTGASTLEAARLVGPSGTVTGADISPVMLARARERAAQVGLGNVAFAHADAQTHPFGRRFDAAISRFGMMFFADPVAAFANIAAALRPGGRIVFIAWGALQQNPWFALPRQAAVDRLGAPEPPAPRAPGPMAFAEQDYVTGMLAQAGLSAIAAREVALDLTPPGTAAELAAFATHVGPASRILAEKDGTQADAAAIVEALCAALGPFETGSGLRVPATLNLFTARVALSA